MKVYQYYRPMPLVESARRAHLEALQYELERVCRQLSWDIFSGAFTDTERQVIDAALSATLQRTAAGIAEFDCYKLPEPVLVEDWSYEA